VLQKKKKKKNPAKQKNHTFLIGSKLLEITVLLKLKTLTYSPEVLHLLGVMSTPSHSRPNPLTTWERVKQIGNEQCVGHPQDLYSSLDLVLC
jgi:hypothetical protein